MKRLIVINIIFALLLVWLPAEETKQISVQVSDQVSEQVIASRGLETPRQQEEIPAEQATIKNKATNINQAGIDLIKQFEGLRTQSYRLQGEQNYTIGYRAYRSRC